MHYILMVSLLFLSSCAHRHEPPAGAAATGTGALTFYTIPGWGVPEGEVGIGATHGSVVVDKAGRVYVSTQAGVFVYTAAGEKVNSFMGGDYTHMHAMTIHTEGGEEYIYGARIGKANMVKFKTDGTIALKIPYPEVSGAKVKKFIPTAVAVLPDGDILIADGYGSNIIFRFDSKGKYKSHFGGKNKEAENKFLTPHGIALDKRYQPARLLISDREKRRLVHFDLDGNFIEEVVTGLRRPCAVSILGDYVAVAELESRVVILDGDNEIVSVLGDNPDKGHWANYKVHHELWNEGVFTAPHGLTWDHEGNLYVEDWNVHGRITKLVREKSVSKLIGTSQ